MGGVDGRVRAGWWWWWLVGEGEGEGREKRLLLSLSLLEFRAEAFVYHFFTIF